MLNNHTEKDIPSENSVASCDPILPPFPFQSSALNNLKSSQISPLPLENLHVPRNFSRTSEYSSYSTEQLIPSHRVSVLSEETIENRSSQFKFEKSVQSSLKLMNCTQKFCNSCRTNTYFSERYELPRLNIAQHFFYLLQSLKCCSEPKRVGNYHKKMQFCIYCGNNL